MTDIERQFLDLESWLQAEFDQLEADTRAKFRWLARSTGQRTRARTDRKKKLTPFGRLFGCCADDRP